MKLVILSADPGNNIDDISYDHSLYLRSRFVSSSQSTENNNNNNNNNNKNTRQSSAHVSCVPRIQTLPLYCHPELPPSGALRLPAWVDQITGSRSPTANQRIIIPAPGLNNKSLLGRSPEELPVPDAVTVSERDNGKRTGGHYLRSLDSSSVK